MIFYLGQGRDVVMNEQSKVECMNWRAAEVWCECFSRSGYDPKVLRKERSSRQLRQEIRIHDAALDLHSPLVLDHV